MNILSKNAVNGVLLKNIIKFLFLITVAVSVNIFAPSLAGLNAQQSLSCAIFLMSILGTLLFWEFRLGIAFSGVSILLLSGVLSIEHMVKFASVEVVFFLMSMMIIVGMLQDAGVFQSMVGYFIRMRNLSGKRLVIALCAISAISSCLLDEVTSIMFTAALILEICDFYEMDPVPFLIMGVMATNIGSSATVLGNPIGIIIASKSGLTFEHFLKFAFPLAFLSLGLMMLLFIISNKSLIDSLNTKIKRDFDNDFFRSLLDIPMEKRARKALQIAGVIFIFIVLHHRIEVFLGLETNTVLIAVPLIAAGLILIMSKEHAKTRFLNAHQDWLTLFFFMFLFAQAGTLKHTGVTAVLAENFSSHPFFLGKGLMSVMLWLGAIVSGFLDNVVFVVTTIPIIQSLSDAGMRVQVLWWAVLFGGCIGGNLTMVGSTANIVALGLFEKKYKKTINFFTWIRYGFLITLCIITFLWAVLFLMMLLGII